ncbi:NACHT, LRR and PYD domains-containing protein 12-like [Parambassis ranga]|uniref:NACHT, LRR and PYD domains-containing protein 12-like n=1 Tax=Parambassis ranga TaxID=210632 RepID=A0A6P7IFM4_9TELE|nr:NACHT, LRR and PYD domains-containing protein 12-like [Parambassis ranga]XP_028267021.1 NACHT, LRR and PYD domains-containing protein 12-like [Parambassis ranga]
MGIKCSVLRRGKMEANHNQKEEDVSSTVRRKRNSSLQEEDTGAKKTAKETTADENDGSERSRPLVHEQITAAVTSTNHMDPASAFREEKEAAWVDSHRAELIQSVTLVMQIADEMLDRNIIQQEMYDRIRANMTTQDQMRELYRALSCTAAKSAFYKILHNLQPDTCGTEEIIQEAIRRHKEYLRKLSLWDFEDFEKAERSLDTIYTELHIIQGEVVDGQHELCEIEQKTSRQTAEGAKIKCNDLFKKEDTGASGRGKDVKEIRTVMTKGIAGIGKTVSVKKFILDWADGRANQDLDFIFMLPFRELNLVKDDQYSLEMLVKEFQPELKNVAAASIFNNRKVLFILDGLDESQLPLNFKTNTILKDATKKSSVDVLVTNLIRVQHLLPSAHVWITSRPAAVQRIPRRFVDQWTEVRGFSDEQKILYFKRRVEDKTIAERIIGYVTESESLYSMCHIPLFCWIAAKVFEYLLQNTDDVEDENTERPTTLTEMFTHFLLFQLRRAAEKYEHEDESDTEAIVRSNKQFILNLGRLAFEHLAERKFIFTGEDLKRYSIDTDKAAVHSGLCTAIYKEESVLYKRKLYCFVHLTVQEYLAALFVYYSFARKKIDSPSLKKFLLKGSEEELQSILEDEPEALPLDELIEITIANSCERKTGELDMFLRFLVGMSLQSTQNLLQGLIEQKEEHSAVVEEIKTSLINIDLLDCPPERCLNLVHCLTELKDTSIHQTVQQYLEPNHDPENQLTPVQCSALADAILRSSTPLNEFNLMKFRPSTRGIFRLLPAVKNCRIVRITGIHTLVCVLAKPISSALQMPNSVLTELHLTDCTFGNKSPKVMIEGLKNAQCKLEALSLSGSGFTDTECENLASALKSLVTNLRELELSGNVLRGSLLPVLSVGFGCSKLEQLRLNRNPQTAEICQQIVTAISSSSSYLRQLEMSYSNFKDSEMEILSVGLMSSNCPLETLRLSHNKLTERGCETLASALSSKPSRLTELDLSYNELQDSGVRALCGALMSPHCGLRTLRLSFCKVTADGGSSVASALRSDHCSLRELDLSFNHLTDQGVQLLTDIQEDSGCSLERLNVDQNEECWVDLKLLRQYACALTLDPNTAGVSVLLTSENKMAAYVIDDQPYPEHPDRFSNSQVLCKEALSGRHYWEVECDSADVAVAYRSIRRAADSSSEYSLGQNENSWCWTYNRGYLDSTSCVEFLDFPPKQSVIGVYVDQPVGVLSFFEVHSDTLTHLYTVHTAFTEPLHPGFRVDGSVLLHEIKQAQI